MRPQHITAENSSRLRGVAADDRASMRPQHITAENPTGVAGPVKTVQASMRPQHITAENGRDAPTGVAGVPGFNEAAAYHCGKRHQAPRRAAGPAASMRPQHITAENAPSA